MVGIGSALSRGRLFLTMQKTFSTLLKTSFVIAGFALLVNYFLSSSNMMSVRTRNLSTNALNGKGRSAVVVGATSGIGEACAIRLAEAGYSVTAVGRNPKRGEAVVASMEQTGGGGSHDFLSCDAFGLKNIETCAQEIIKKRKSIDVLVLSQGMATIQGFTPTSEGNDQKLTLHYWGRMAMITQLLPTLRQSTEPRVVSILSGGVHAPFQNYQKDPELRDSYSIKNAADTAGFYNDLGLDALAHDPKNKDVLFVHAAPGFVNTNWGTEMPWWIRYPVRMLQPLGRTAQDCAEAMCFPCLATKDDVIQTLGRSSSAPAASDENALLVMNPHAQKANVTSLHSPEACQFVWEKTVNVLKRAGVSIP